MTVDRNRYRSHTTIFGDGHNGSAFQLHDVYDGNDKTTMTITWERKNRADSGETTYRYGDQVYKTADDMISAYERDGHQHGPARELHPGEHHPLPEADQSPGGGQHRLKKPAHPGSRRAGPRRSGGV